MNLLFKRYFRDGENIGDKNVLLSIAEEVGLDDKEVDSLLCLNKYGRAVQNDELIAKEIGIEDVPFFIFNEQLAVSGVQTIEIFKNVLEETWQECKEHLDVKNPLNNVVNLTVSETIVINCKM
ncbi:DsbA family oxidoreductase [Pseudogracilibacillus sp. SO30301A]|uniref:DsbA family oxidoreductase n=1 Tax=Pseudogracilibacillus sp. SO30301A TaxID=3098291 RepID=UPI00300E5907